MSDISRTGIRHREVVHILKSWPSLPLYAKDVVKILSRICCWALSVQELVPGKKKKKKRKENSCSKQSEIERQLIEAFPESPQGERLPAFKAV